MRKEQILLFARMKSYVSLTIICFTLLTLPVESRGDWKLSLDTEIASKLALAPENSWIKLNTNRYDTVWTPLEQRPNPPEAPAVGAPHSIIDAWSSMAWDSNRGNIIIYGGGHANYPGNDVYIWESSTLKWARASLPSEVRYIGNGQFESIDGVFNAPVAAHTYDNSEFLPILDRFVTFGGAAFNTGTRYIHTDGSPTGPYFFNPALADKNAVGGTTGSHVNPELFPNVIGKNMWSNRDNLFPSTPGVFLPNYFINTATAYSGENSVDTLYLQANNRLFRYSAFSSIDSSQDTYEVVGTVQSGSTFSGQGAGAFDPQRKIFVRTAGSIFTFWNLDQSPGTIAQNVIFSPDVIGGTFDFTRLDKYGLDFDHKRQLFVLWDGNLDVWQLTPPQDLTSGNWVLNRVTPQGINLPQQQSSTGTPILGKWKYSKALDAFVGLFDKFSGDIWVYKPSNWQPEVVNEGVSIANLKEGDIFYANQSVEIVVYALGKMISSVQYILDGNVIGTSSSVPHTFEWIDRTPGSYALTAVALFTDGSSAESNPINIVASSSTIETITLQQGLNEYTGTADVYLDQSLSTVNTSNSSNLLSRRNNFSQVVPIVNFKIFESEGGLIPDNALIRQAKLSLYKYSVYSHSYGAHRILSDWNVDTVTWLEKDSGSSWDTPGANTSGVDFAADSDGESSIEWNPGWLEIDVLSGVQNIRANGQNFGWKIVSKSQDGNLIRFYSSEYSNDTSLRPSLEIEYVSSSGPANIPPAVNLISPFEGATYAVGNSVLLTADASDTDGIISKVEFYSDGVLLGEDTSSPYEFSWNNATAGAHTLTAVATDDKNKKTTSAAISITVTGTVVNQPPTIDLVSPITGSNFHIGNTVSLRATVNDSDGTVTKVAFYANGNLLNEDFSAPYDFTWTNPTIGTYSLTAVATDDNGAITTSQISQINVTQSGPGNNVIITLQEGLNGYEGTVDSYMYEYFDSANYGENISLLDKVSGSRFASVIRFAIFDSEGGPVPDGSFITSAKLSVYKTSYYDHIYRAHRILLNWSEDSASWGESESGVAWNVAGGLGFGQDIENIPDGESAAGWTPSWLDLDVTSGVQVMSATGQNYGWRLVPVGGNSNTKKFASSEYDIDPTLRPTLEIEYIPDTGMVNLPPEVDLTAPSSGDEFVEETSVLISANASDTDGIISKVEFYSDGVLLGEDTSSPYEFSWNNATAGAHTLTAVATDDGGKQTISLNVSITITDMINDPPTVTLTAPDVGAIFETGEPILIAADANDDGNITKVTFYADGVFLAEITQAPYEYTWLNATVGMHTLHAVATDNGALTGNSASVGVDVTKSPNNSIHVTLQKGLNEFTDVWDSYIYNFHDFGNFGAANKLLDRKKGSLFTSLIRFAIFESEGGFIPDQAVITSAKLKLYKSSFYDQVYRVHPLLVTWREDQVTWQESKLGIFWDQQGAVGLGTDIDSQYDGEGAASWEPGWLIIDVTQGVQAIQNGRANFGWKLVPVSGNNNIKTFVSSDYIEDSTLRPALEIEYFLEE